MNSNCLTKLNSIQVAPSIAVTSTRLRQENTIQSYAPYYEWTIRDVEHHETGPLNMFAIENMSVLAAGLIQILCYPSRLSVEINSLNPSYLRDIYRMNVNNGNLDPRSLPVCFVEEHCFLLAGWAPNHWGHFIFEFLPRLLMIKEYQDNNERFPIYVSSLTPDYIRDAMYYILGDQSIFRYYDDLAFITFTSALTPQFPQYLDSNVYASFNVGYHPHIRKLIDLRIEELQSHRQPLPSKPNDQYIYISRKHASGFRPLSARSIVNEDVVIKLFENMGFRIVSMEDYRLPEQIDLLSGCAVIAGGWGSGLHSSILSCNSPTIISIGHNFDINQMIISDLMSQRLFEIPTYSDKDYKSTLWDVQNVSQYAHIELIKSSVERILQDLTQL